MLANQRFSHASRRLLGSCSPTPTLKVLCSLLPLGRKTHPIRREVLPFSVLQPRLLVFASSRSHISFLPCHVATGTFCWKQIVLAGVIAIAIVSPQCLHLCKAQSSASMYVVGLCSRHLPQHELLCGPFRCRRSTWLSNLLPSS